MPASLIKFQIGPVQDFIAQSRSTRDLWSGSYLLSWLVAAGIKALPSDADLIFPSRDQQPLLKETLDPNDPGLLIPNLPNIFIAEVSGEAETVANKVIEGIDKEWKKIAKAVWDSPARQSAGIKDTVMEKNRFDAQVDRHLSISWQTTPVQDDYHHAYQHNGWHLDAVRQTRDFIAWKADDGPNEKDSLSGKEEALFQGSGNPNKSNVWHNLLHKHTDRLGSVALIKRVWHLAYLEPNELPVTSKKFPIRSIPAIAARNSKLDDEEEAQERTSGEKYIAAIAFDGDSIGAWVNGDKSPPDTDLRGHHTAFSKALSDFALNKVAGIVAPEDEWLGQLIYAGGDDVVCLVPADAALDVAKELREAFRQATTNTPSKDGKPDASAGIAIAHIHAPLQDLIREAQKAEKRAKNDVGRPAFSVTLLKRSGEISQWGSKWNSGGLELYRAIADHLKPGGLSAKFPHRVCQLLTPYLTNTTGLSKQQDAITDPGTARELIEREFTHAASQQGSKAIAAELSESLQKYLQNLEQNTQHLLTSIIDLCTTVAFADRTKPAPAEKPSA